MPGVNKTFSWADPHISAEEHRNRPGFRKHVKAIGEVWVTCMGNLEDIDQQQGRLKGLGGLHNKKNVQFHYYEVSFFQRLLLKRNLIRFFLLLRGFVKALHSETSPHFSLSA